MFAIKIKCLQQHSYLSEEQFHSKQGLLVMISNVRKENRLKFLKLHILIPDLICESVVSVCLMFSKTLIDK